MRKSQCVSVDEDSDSETKDINEGWPEKAHYHQAAAGTQNISILAQPQPMKTTIKAAVNQITAFTLFKTAFPQWDPTESLKYHRSVLIKSAKTLGNMELSQRFKEDDKLVLISAQVVSLINLNQLYYIDYFVF